MRASKKRASRLTPFILSFAFVAAGLSQSLPLDELGQPLRSPDVTIRRRVPTNVFPPTVSTYHILPTKFSPAVLSNLMAVARLTEADRMKGAGENFVSADKSRTLRINPLRGTIEYTDTSVVHSGLTDRSVDVPREDELFGLTTNLLPKLGLRLSEIKRMENSTEPEFNFYEPQLTMFQTNSMLLTNIPQRSVFFRRRLDGGAVLGNDEGGNCWIFFGSHHAISKIRLQWPSLERYKTFPTADFNTITRWIGEGKGRHGLISSDVGEIDWSKIKTLTVKKAEICYITKGKYIHPLASLWTTVESGTGNFDVEIDCPVSNAPNL